MHRTCTSLAGLVLFLFVLGAPGALAQGPEFTWKQGGKIIDAHFLDANRGWTVEDGARVRVLDPITHEWEFGETPLDAREDLHSIQFLDQSVGFACGVGGTILRSVDGGANWDHANTTPILNRNSPPAPATLNSIHMFNATDGWVVGDDGAMWFTDNGWQTWGIPSGCTLPAFLDGSSDPDNVYKIAFLDAMHGFASADWGRCYVTSDGGCTWAVAKVSTCGGGAAEGPDHPNLHLWDFAFSDLNGIMVGGVGVQEAAAFTTADGGQSWAPASCYELGFPLVGDCSPPTIYGATVAQSMSGPLPAACGYGSMAFAFEPGTATLDQCACPSPPACAGSIWVQKDTPAPDAPKPILFGMEAIGGDEVLLCGDFGVLRRLFLSTGTSIDEGTVDYRRLSGGAFPNATTGCVIAQGNVILRTTSSGDDWDVVYEPQPPQSGLFGTDIAFSSSGSQAVAVGEGSFVAWSSNAGQSWFPPLVGPNGNVSFEAVAFAPGGAVYAVAGAGAVWYSADGGIHWAALPSPPTTQTLYGVSFATSSVGYVVGADQTAFLTQDGGASWSAVPIHGGVPGEDFLGVATEPASLTSLRVKSS